MESYWSLINAIQSNVLVNAQQQNGVQFTIRQPSKVIFTKDHIVLLLWVNFHEDEEREGAFPGAAHVKCALLTAAVIGEQSMYTIYAMGPKKGEKRWIP